MKLIITGFLFACVLAGHTNLLADTTPSADISQQEAADIATQAHPGRVLGVKRKSKNYQVKTLSKKGKLRVINIDARTGKIKSGKRSNSKKSNKKRK